jgi:RNA polymerase sigma-70 factor (ECF subfamily)
MKWKIRTTTAITKSTAIEAVSATETARINATFIRVTGDWGLAEDCIQDAFARALVDWPVHGVPRNPGPG